MAVAGAWASGGSFGDVMKAVGISFAQMAVFHYVGGILDGVGEQMAALGKATTAAGKAAFAAVKGAVHGVIGGAFAVASGGRFAEGFAGAAIGAAAGVASNGLFGQAGDGTGWMMARTAMAAAAGCAGAIFAGGKCGNGALTAAMAHIFNAECVHCPGRRGGLGGSGLEVGGGGGGAGAAVSLSAFIGAIYNNLSNVFAPADVGSGGRALNTVRLQAQGAGLEASVVITGTDISVKDGHLGLTKLANGIGEPAALLRRPLFIRASRYITNCAANGGCGAPGLGFDTPGTNIRVDVNIFGGTSFRTIPRSGATIDSVKFD
ncbi:MAG: hypothetical protein K0U74_13115 [Alphaproteobacteria bacterium]|nr:hypothetical protein [Alphaproteobacteria bacterium]